MRHLTRFQQVPALALVAIICVLLYGGHLINQKAGRTNVWADDNHVSQRSGDEHQPVSLANTHETEGALKRTFLIQSGGIPKEGFGSTLFFIKPAIAMAHVLGRTLRLTQTHELFGYRVTSLLQADEMTLQGSHTICDLHNTILEDGSSGDFWLRVDRSYDEVDNFVDTVTNYCSSNMTQPFEMLPHIRQRLEMCDVVIWADQSLRGEGGWTPCTRPWLRQQLRIPVPSFSRTVGMHYRWFDIPRTQDPKWLVRSSHSVTVPALAGKVAQYNTTEVEMILSAIRSCGSSHTASLFMKAAFFGETWEERLASIAPIKSLDRLVDTGDDLNDLVELASHDILILNAGLYSEAAAAASSARIVIHNGYSPETFHYLKLHGTVVLDTVSAAKLDWCAVLDEMT